MFSFFEALVLSDGPQSLEERNTMSTRCTTRYIYLQLEETDIRIITVNSFSKATMKGNHQQQVTSPNV